MDRIDLLDSGFLYLEAHERYKANHGHTRDTDLEPSEFELKAMAEFFKAQFDTSAHFLGVIKSYAATWLGLGNGLAVPWRHVPHTLMNTQVSSARRFVAQSWSIDRVRAVSKAADVTINDVVLAMCSGALRRYLDDQGEHPEHSLRALVPVSVRGKGDFDSSIAISYIVANMMYTRFCYTTGDAAGQNMTGKATLYACEWIRANHPAKPRYILSGNIDTDKKHSMMNMIQTRGKRVVAEFVLKRDVAKELLRIEPEWLYRYRQIAGIGTQLAGAAYGGAHSANGIAAMFIATGQDAANVSESHAGMNYVELLDNGDLYWSTTLPAMICATYGGGTGLPTQRECLEMMDCYGTGKGNKLAEIIAGVVLAGDVSLSSAILAHEWVSSHEMMGRNR